MKNRSFLKTAFLIMLCLSLIPAGGLFTEERTENKEEAETDIWDAPISFKFDQTQVSDAAAFFSESAGVNVILAAGMTDYFNQKGITLTLKLDRTPLYEAVSIVAEVLGVVADIRDRNVILKWKPEIKQENIIGRITIKRENTEVSLNIYDGDIPYSLKKDLIEASLFHQLRRLNNEEEEMEIKMDHLFDQLEEVMEQEQKREEELGE